MTLLTPFFASSQLTHLQSGLVQCYESFAHYLNHPRKCGTILFFIEELHIIYTQAFCA